MSAIPQSILDVKRPANTAVLDTHTDSNRRYVVRRRATSEELAAKPGVKYKETIGYIMGVTTKTGNFDFFAIYSTEGIDFALIIEKFYKNFL